MSSREVAKLRAVVSYFATHLDPKPGKVQLFKLMFLADFKARAKLGCSISGDTYVKFELGPVPKHLREDFGFITKGCVTIHQRQIGYAKRNKMELHPVPNSTHEQRLDANEIDILDQICHEYGHKTGQQLIDFTHETIPFRATPHNSEIRYGLARYLDYEPFSATDVQRIVDRDRADIVEALAYATDHPVGT